MTVSSLTPKLAAGIARGVYLLRESSIADAVADGFDLGLDDQFGIEDSRRFDGRSGALVFRKLSGFGYLATGAGRRSGELLVATRGTAIGVDWLSNLNIGMQRGPSGALVHAGFHEVWKSFQTELGSFVRNRNFSHVHCVGHSLGGALAALNADYFSSNRIAAVSLYTFGSPRAGCNNFSEELTGRIGSGAIHRVSHAADPVPMIPIFPFRHAPHDRGGYRIGNGGGLINVAAHGMAASYIPGVGALGWSELATEDDEPTSDERIKSWVDSSAGMSGPAHCSAKLLGMIARALNWLLQQAKNLLVGALGTVLAVGATVLDQVAWLLARAAALSAELAGYLKALIGAIFRYLGRAASKATEITSGFLSWVLGLLWSSLQGTATRALHLFGAR